MSDIDKSETVFRAEDLRHTKAYNQGEYFVKKAKEPFGKRFKTWIKKNKKLLIVVVAVLLLLIVTLVVLLVIKPFEKHEEPIVIPEEDITKVEDGTEYAVETSAVSAEALGKFEESGDVNDLYEVYEKYINAAEEAGEKRKLSEIWGQRSLDLWLNCGQACKDEILVGAYKAEEIYPTAGTAFDISYYESLYGSLTKAAEYKALAAERDPNMLSDEEYTEDVRE